ncbi:uncharacterized protein LOC107019477 [Solanum pennellii]|uniref:Uncharacterized protein LOC107019477 n=1 Tax=Solanum pennellii TaxID=28526 RepID=A0ABM1GSV0_SOLPN|nr:uncharacterized protein LOC107019477 [Solanum pennellii]
MDDEVRATFLQMAQAITTHAQGITTQANREVVPPKNQHVSTMATRLRDFTRMNPLMLFGDEMSRYVAGLSEELEEECFASMIHDNMDLSRMMVHAQQVKESHLRKKNREAKKARVRNSKYQKGRNVDSPRERPTCGKCGKKHVCECLVGTNSCYGCGKSGHMLKYYPNVKVQGKGNSQVQSSSPSSEAPKRNRFYALKARGEQESSHNVVTGMLQAFSINVYALLDPGSTLSLVTPLVSWKFDILPNVLVESFLLCTSMGDLVVARRVYRKCPVMLPSRVTLVDLIEL